LIPIGFIAAFIDSIAGGGGIISLPAFLLAGLPPHMALGTNKLASTAGSLTSSLQYTHSAKVDFQLLKYLIPFTLIGAILGAHTVINIDQRLLSIMVLVLVLGVGIYSLFSQKIGQNKRWVEINVKRIAAGMLLAFGLGFYDGFFGPGTGSFLMFGLIALYGMDFIESGGNARVLNFVSNIAALITFVLQHQVDYWLGIPVLLAMSGGAYLGSKTALNKGVKLVKPIFVMMSLAIAAKMLFNLFQ
jgi:Predicted permeases